MLKVKIICVGKLKEKYLIEGIKEYQKRLKVYCNFEIIEVSDVKAPESLSEAQMIEVKNKEGQLILNKIKPNDFVIALEPRGTMFSSEDLAAQFEKCAVNSQNSIAFIIGGSLGISDEVLQRSQVKMAISKMIFPHQLIRLMFIEQIYRGFKINANEPYHK